MPAKITRTKAFSDKTNKEYPRLPILGQISIGSEGKNFQHGVGVLATGDPATNQPRISVGSIWYPEDNGERHPAFMRHTSTLTLEQAETFAADILAQVKAARKGDFVVTQKPRRETAKATTPAPQQDASVAATVREQVLASLVKMGMSEAQAEAAYTQSQELLQSKDEEI